MHLVFIDADRQERDALLLAIHGDPHGELYQQPRFDERGQFAEDEDGHVLYEDGERRRWPCVNLVVVEKIDSAQDQYGRQTVKDGVTSVCHWTDNTAHGFCWRFRDEVMTGSPAMTIS